MSRPFTTYGDHSTDYLSTQHPNSSPSGDFKSSYNDDLSDLIDQYAQPYSRTSRHQTFAVSTDPLDDSDSRDRSFSTEQKGSYSVDKVPEEDAEPDPSNHDYPPTLKQEKPIDTRSYWAKVSTIVSQIPVVVTEIYLDSS
jgi:hypothetical protein